MSFDNWVVFEDGSAGCVVCPPERGGSLTPDEAKEIAEKLTGKKVISVAGLPYAASPVLNRDDSWPAGWAMALCYSPNRCSGRSSCPKRYACSE